MEIIAFSKEQMDLRHIWDDMLYHTFYAYHTSGIIVTVLMEIISGLNTFQCHVAVTFSCTSAIINGMLFTELNCDFPLLFKSLELMNSKSLIEYHFPCRYQQFLLYQRYIFLFFLYC